MSTVKIRPWPYPNSQTFVPDYWNPSEADPNPPWIYTAFCEDPHPKPSRWGRWRVKK